MSLITNSEFYYQNIRNKLTELCSLVAIDNSLNIQSLNIHAEGFYAEFLNCLFDWNLVNANTAKQNAAGIDLIDEGNKIIVQVSISHTHSKIQRCLDLCDRAEYIGYHFYFAAITEGTIRYRPFIVPEGIIFDREDDVLNISVLLRYVLNAGITKQKALSELMDKYFGVDKVAIKGRYLTAPPPFADTNSVICRETELEEIQKRLQEKKSTLLISGFVGIGKTALARLVFHTVRKNYDQVAWIPYHRCLKDSLLSHIQLKEDIRDMDVRWNEIEKILNNGLSKLIVIDNADRDQKTNQSPQDDALLRDITGYRNVTVILTSRLKEIYDYAYYEVGFLSENACAALFYKHYENGPERAQEAAVKALVELAQYHTLTIELIAKGAMWETNLWVYYDKLKKSFANAKCKVRMGHNDKYATIKAHPKVLFDISGRTDEEKAALWDFAVLPAGAALTLEETELWFQHDPNVLDLLQHDGWMMLWGDEHYAMPPLVKEILHLDPIPENTAKTFLAFIANWNNGYFSYNDVYIERARKLALAESVVAAVCREDTLQLAHILDNMGGAYRQAGQYPRAEAHYLRAIAIKEDKLGKDHIETAITYNNIALVYQNMGELDKALEFFEKDLAISEAKLGKDHSSTATTYNNIAGVNQAKGDFDKALKFYEKALIIREANLGEDHLTTAVTYDNIAGIYQAKREFNKALKFYEKALAINEAKLGEDHPHTAATYDNIAGVYQDMGNFDKALKIYKKALAIRKVKLGEDHPETATTYNNIAAVYQAKRKLVKALEFYQKAKDIREAKLGEDHPHTATTYSNIALVYEEMGDLDKALEFLEKARTIREAKLGKDHPHTATTYNNMAFVYEAMGDLDKALEFYQKALAIREDKLGEDHLATATTYNNRAFVYEAMGDLDKALEFHEKALAIRETRLGESHPDTADTYRSISAIYLALGDGEKAISYSQKVRLVTDAKEDHAYALMCELLADEETAKQRAREFLDQFELQSEDHKIAKKMVERMMSTHNRRNRR